LGAPQGRAPSHSRPGNSDGARRFVARTIIFYTATIFLLKTEPFNLSKSSSEAQKTPVMTIFSVKDCLNKYYAAPV